MSTPSQASGSQLPNVAPGRSISQDQPGTIQRLARLGTIGLLVLAIANGVYLYLLPGMADTDYAWPIRPEINAAFLGAGYLAGVYAASLAVFVATRWRSIRSLIRPFFTLGVILFAATMIHADRFRWGFPPTWVWTVVYAAIPIASVIIWRKQERDAPPAEPFDSRLALLRPPSLALGAVTALVGGLMFLTPSTFVDNWPWPITPLLARSFSGWYLLVAVIFLVGWRTFRHAYEVLIPYGTVVVWNILLLLLPVIYLDSITTGEASFIAWLVLHAVSLAASLWLVIQSYRIFQAEQQML